MWCFIWDLFASFILNYLVKMAGPSFSYFLDRCSRLLFTTNFPPRNSVLCLLLFCVFLQIHLPFHQISVNSRLALVVIRCCLYFLYLPFSLVGPTAVQQGPIHSLSPAPRPCTLDAQLLLWSFLLVHTNVMQTMNFSRYPQPVSPTCDVLLYVAAGQVAMLFSSVCATVCTRSLFFASRHVLCLRYPIIQSF